MSFPAGTLIRMVDGKEKAIEEVVIGDQVLLGGEVTGCVCFIEDSPLYEYLGVKVTSEQAVFENDSWTRINISVHGRKTNDVAKRIFHISNKNHQVMIGEVLFSDFEETDHIGLNNEESLEELNRGLVCYRC